MLSEASALVDSLSLLETYQGRGMTPLKAVGDIFLQNAELALTCLASSCITGGQAADPSVDKLATADCKL